jgi:hypothetical protein
MYATRAGDDDYPAPGSGVPGAPPALRGTPQPTDGPAATARTARPAPARPGRAARAAPAASALAVALLALVAVAVARARSRPAHRP